MLVNQQLLILSLKKKFQLHLENDRIVFSARFSGEVKQLFIPPSAVQAIYSKENGRGMVFSDEDEVGGDEPPQPTPPPSTAGDRRVGSSSKPKLTVIK